MPYVESNSEETRHIKRSSSDVVNALLMAAIMGKIIGVPIKLNVDCYFR
jgi:hypothetical protein